MDSEFLRAFASTYADVILKAVRQEYPNAMQHVTRHASDQPTPRLVHPAFYGCFDWHSAVHMHWTLLRLLHLVPEAIDGADAQRVFEDHFSAQALEQERQYFLAHPRFERPYGWAWVLRLAAELTDWPEGAPWAAAMRPLAETISQFMLDWLERQTYPIRYGVHSNSAFALVRSLPWARQLEASGQPDLLNAIGAAAQRWYAADRDYPAAWEPSAHDFLSPALCEAELISELLDSDAFAVWLKGFLPGLAQGEPRTLFLPVVMGDERDGQAAHLYGLNLYRAFAFKTLAQRLPVGDDRHAILEQAATAHATDSLGAVSGTDYMLEHWLATYAVMYLTASDKSKKA